MCVCVCVCVYVCVCMCGVILVGIWCDMLGNIHLWKCPLLWCSGHVHLASTQKWAAADETEQPCLHRSDVSSVMSFLKLILCESQALYCT